MVGTIALIYNNEQCGVFNQITIGIILIHKVII